MDSPRKQNGDRLLTIQVRLVGVIDISPVLIFAFVTTIAMQIVARHACKDDPHARLHIILTNTAVDLWQ